MHRESLLPSWTWGAPDGEPFVPNKRFLITQCVHLRQPLVKTLSTMVLWSICYYTCNFGHGVGREECRLPIGLELLSENSEPQSSE